MQIKHGNVDKKKAIKLEGIFLYDIWCNLSSIGYFENKKYYNFRFDSCVYYCMFIDSLWTD